MNKINKMNKIRRDLYSYILSLLVLPSIPLLTACTDSTSQRQARPQRQVVVQQVKIPVRQDAPQICTNPGILDIVSKIRRQCVKGKCDVDKLLSESNTVKKEDFYTLIRDVDYNKITFFFKSGKTKIDKRQKTDKAPKLQAILSTMIADRSNTVAFIIAKASKTGRTMNNRLLSTKRAAAVFNMIDEVFKEQAESFQCQHIYRTYVGDELFQINPKIAQKMGYIDEEDIKRKGREKLSNYVNQSAVVFTYPCFKEMCYHMRDVQQLSCSTYAAADKQLPEECIELICSP